MLVIYTLVCNKNVVYKDFTNIIGIIYKIKTITLIRNVLKISINMAHLNFILCNLLEYIFLYNRQILPKIEILSTYIPLLNYRKQHN